MWHAFASPIEIILDASEKQGKHEEELAAAHYSASRS
jgi:hypothetical protein